MLSQVFGVAAPPRVSLQQELEGLDISQRGEALQEAAHPVTIFVPCR